MNVGRSGVFYLAGIALNAVALAYAIVDGEFLFALAFGLVLVYLAVRYRMHAGDGQ